jgi:DNA-binding beta-propeller fold protein YncE
MRASTLFRTFLLSLSATVVLLPCSGSATTIAYAAEFLPGGLDYVRTNFIDPPYTLGGIMLTSVGAFVGDDYSHQYFIDEALGRLQTIDVLTGVPGVIGSVDVGSNSPTGMHWDPTRDQMFLIATDALCVSTTLYRLDVSNASTVEIGTTTGCILGLAIDENGRAFGIDQTHATLVSIDTSTGATATVGPLGLTMQPLGGLDFDPENGSLYVFGYDSTTGSNGMFLVNTALGNGTLFHTYGVTLLAVSLAPALDAIMANGFEAP